MAAARGNGVRLNPEHDARTRSKIQTSQLINRLNDYAFGKCEMTRGQVKAAEILLKKALPDLSAITLDGDINHSVDLVDRLERARKRAATKD